MFQIDGTVLMVYTKQYNLILERLVIQQPLKVLPKRHNDKQ